MRHAIRRSAPGIAADETPLMLDYGPLFQCTPTSATPPVQPHLDVKALGLEKILDDLRLHRLRLRPNLVPTARQRELKLADGQ